MKTANDVLKYIRAVFEEDFVTEENLVLATDVIEFNDPVVNNMVMKINDTEFWLISVKKASKQ